MRAHATGRLELPDLPLKPPRAPEGIGRERAARWRRLWSLPIAGLASRLDALEATL